MADGGLEIERKYILAAPPGEAVLATFGRPVRIEQRYLVDGPGGTTRRLRVVQGDGPVRYVYTEKDRVGPEGPPDQGPVVHAEREEEIAAERHASLLAQADPAARVVVKDRWRIPVDDLVFELDHVHEPVELWVLEVELEHPEVRVEVPGIFGPVREDPACSMAALARGAYPPSADR